MVQLRKGAHHDPTRAVVSSTQSPETPTRGSRLTRVGGAPTHRHAVGPDSACEPIASHDTARPGALVTALSRPIWPHHAAVAALADEDWLSHVKSEVSRSLVRAIGSNISTIDGSNGFQFGVGTGRQVASNEYAVGGPLAVGNGASEVVRVLPDGTEVPGPAVGTVGNGTTLGAFGNLFGLNILGALDLAETNGLVTTLSEFNLAALSGETADFLAGGEFPVPISQGLGATSVEYRNYGVKLIYTPTVLADGRISIRVAPEVSELSSQGAVTLNGFQIPAVTVRKASTTLELGSGQSFMIAGLMTNNAQNSIDKAPGLGDVPILGNLFRSTNFRKGETELVIVITPYLVKPVNGNDIRLPTDGYNSPNVLSQQFGFQENARGDGPDRPVPRASDRQSAGPAISQGDQERTRRAGKPGRKQRSASAAPGFSINK